MGYRPKLKSYQQPGTAFSRLMNEKEGKRHLNHIGTGKRKKNKKRRLYYCYECLRKFGPNSTTCPDCKCELRGPFTPRIRAQVVTRLARKRGVKPPRRRDVYEAYLASDLWITIRTRVLQRDNHICRDCGGRANSVHHLSYAPEVMAGNDDSKLVSLCWPCHEERHPEKRRKTQPSGRTATVGNQVETEPETRGSGV